MTIPSEIIHWLLEGDPAIRWQTMRDLLAAPEADWQAERQRTLDIGWGARLLSMQDEDGKWGGGIYSPKWTSTTYTLLNLCEIGIPRDYSAARRGADLVIDSLLGEQAGEKFQQKLMACDRCIVGMVLQIALYFGIDFASGGERIEAIVDNLLQEQMPDGGWNCRRHRRPEPHHSSFHTTLNVLNGLRNYVELYPGTRRAEVIAAEQRAQELLLQHHLYKSDKTGEIIHPKFALMSFPPRWHYDFMRGLDYLARAQAPYDKRLQDPIALLQSKQGADGRWPIETQYSAKVFFNMESVGKKPSRWNTLRALRILHWWEQITQKI